MGFPGWLDDTRTSYDTVAVSYADLLRDALAREPFQRGILALFAEMVCAQGNGPVADVGYGPGRITAHLHSIGLDAFGIDLSPAMIDVARRDHPGLRFEVGSMTRRELADDCLTGLLAWFSLIHVPDDEVPTVLAIRNRGLRRPGRLVCLPSRGLVLSGLGVRCSSRNVVPMRSSARFSARPRWPQPLLRRVPRRPVGGKCAHVILFKFCWRGPVGARIQRWRVFMPVGQWSR